MYLYQLQQIVIVIMKDSSKEFFLAITFLYRSFQLVFYPQELRDLVGKGGYLVFVFPIAAINRFLNHLNLCLR